jgi:hypothetical protein
MNEQLKYMQGKTMAQKWAYKELVCIEKYGALNVELDDGVSAQERFPAQRRPLGTYLSLLGDEGWEVVGITDGAIAEPEVKTTGFQRLRLRILRIEKLLPLYQPGAKKVYIILKRAK